MTFPGMIYFVKNIRKLQTPEEQGGSGTALGEFHTILIESSIHRYVCIPFQCV